MFKDTYKELERFIPKLSYYLIDEVHPEANQKDTVFDGLANSVVATMKLQRVASTDKFTEYLNELKEIIKNPDYRNKFNSFMFFYVDSFRLYMTTRLLKKLLQLRRLLK